MTDNSCKAVLLDMDGTLVDSVAPLYRLYFEFLEARGSKGSDEEFHSLNGPSLRQVAAHFMTNHGLPGTVDEILDQYLDNIAGAYRETIPPHEGADAALAELKTRGFKLALVTANHPRIISQFLPRAGWDMLFDAVVSGEDVENAKPFPDIYLFALNKLGVEAGSAVAVEDSPNGVRAAAAAGCFTVGVTHHYAADKLLAAGAATTIASLSQLPDVVESALCKA